MSQSPRIEASPGEEPGAAPVGAADGSTERSTEGSAIPGPRSRSAASRLAAVECPAFGYRRDTRASASAVEMTPIVLAEGSGVELVDVDGNRYVDLAAGFGSVLLGHGAPLIRRAIEAQSGRLIQALGDVYSADVKLELLERLAALHPGPSPKVLLAQSGSDAITAGIKTAALATGRPGLVAFEGSYHGLGYAPLPACGLRESYRAPFEAQLNPRVAFIPYPRDEAGAARSIEALEGAIRRVDAGAVLIEPILGRGGCVVPPAGFLAAVCEASRRAGALVIADEIWTGLGRSGAMVRSIADGAVADILCFGKGLGAGLPISACVAADDVMQAWARGGEVIHTSTHAGLPLACAAAVATLDELAASRLVERAREVGARAKDALRRELEGRPEVVDVRGEGLMIGIELREPAIAAKATRGMLARGYVALTGGTRGDVITLTPPLTIPEELLVAAGRALAASLSC